MVILVGKHLFVHIVAKEQKFIVVLQDIIVQYKIGMQERVKNIRIVLYMM